jgi:hypothetical protein
MEPTAQPPWQCPTVYKDVATIQGGAPFKLNHGAQKKHYKENLQKMLDAGTLWAFKEAGYNVDTSAYERPMDTDGEFIQAPIVFEEKPSPWVHEKEEAGIVLVRKILTPELSVSEETEMKIED